MNHFIKGYKLLEKMYFHCKIIFKWQDMGWRSILEWPESSGGIPVFSCEKRGALEIVFFDNEICFN